MKNSNKLIEQDIQAEQRKLNRVAVERVSAFCQYVRNPIFRIDAVCAYDQFISQPVISQPDVAKEIELLLSGKVNLEGEQAKIFADYKAIVAEVQEKKQMPQPMQYTVTEHESTIPSSSQTRRGSIDRQLSNSNSR